MIRKILLTISLFILTAFCTFAYSPYIPSGTSIKVNTKIPITTEHLEEGSIVYFIAPSDVWVLEKKAISKGDIFRGYVSMLKMPVKGVNAAMSITITHVLKTDGTVDELKGRIIFANKDVLGGDLTNPASYNKTIHPIKVYGSIWGGAMQYVPSGDYEFGHHVGVSMRDNLFIQIDEDYYI